MRCSGARGLVVGCLLGVAGATAARSQTACVPAVVERDLAQVRVRQKALLQQKVDEITETAVPPAMRVQIGQLKDALANVVDGSMRCAPAGVDAKALEPALAKILEENQPEKPKVAEGEDEPEGSWTYGGGLKVGVTTPANMPELRVVTVSFGIECGRDTMLLLYEWAGWGWRRSLRWQSDGYAVISGAFGDFFNYAVVPGVGVMPLRVVVAHGTPWCTSRFSDFKMDLLDRAAEGGARVAWHMEREYSRGDAEITLSAKANIFELRLNAPALDVSAYERTVIYRYQADGGRVVRVAPIATTGRGFVEEWLMMPWYEAKDQTLPEVAAGMQHFHDRVEQLDRDPKTYVNYMYGPVRACVMKGRYEVEMDATPGGPEFFSIQEMPEGYVMANYGTTHDERCNGPDLMKKP